MASNLLNTFKKIDNHRKLLIDKANAQGAALPETASFIDLVPHIGADKPVMLPEYVTELNTEDWVRPEEWPDCESIFNNAEVRDGFYPGVIMLLDATHSDTIVLPRYIASSSSEYLYNDVGSGNICASGYLLSDGTWYGNTTNEITHEWDTTKDIVVDTGRLPGRYRWIILYYSTSKSIYLMNFARFPAVEIMVGSIANSGLSYPGLFVSYYNDGRETLNKYLKSIVFLPNCNITQLSWSWGQNRYLFGGYKLLENIDVRRSSISLSSVGSNALFYNCKRLRHLDLVNQFKWTSQFSLNGCDSLTTFKAQISYMNLNGNFFQLKKVNNGGQSLRISGYAPDDVVIEECILYGTVLPSYWKDPKGFRLDYTNYGNGDYNSGKFFHNNLFITKLDFSKTPNFGVANANPVSAPTPNINTSSTCRVIIGKGSFKLKEIIWPTKINERIDTSGVVLYKHVIIDLFDKLADITGNNGTYDWVTIHPTNYDELTEEELAIATNKGWEVVRGWPY